MSDSVRPCLNEYYVRYIFYLFTITAHSSWFSVDENFSVVTTWSEQIAFCLYSITKCGLIFCIAYSLPNTKTTVWEGVVFSKSFRSLSRKHFETKCEAGVCLERSQNILVFFVCFSD